MTALEVILPVVVLIISVVVLTRMRPGGPGPAVGWVPKRLRPWMNSQYRRHGYQEPFDENGHRRPGREGL